MLTVLEANRIYNDAILNDTILTQRLLNRLNIKIYRAADSCMTGLALDWTVFNDGCVVSDSAKHKVICALIELGYDVAECGENGITVSWKDEVIKKL